MYSPTGEVRPPKEGEWFLKDGKSYLAFEDFKEERYMILKLEVAKEKEN